MTVSSAPERAILVGLCHRETTLWTVEESLNELALLAATAGARVVDRLLQIRPTIDPATLIGAGKAEQIGTCCRRKKAGLVLFDDDLSPAQLRNLERLIGQKIVDRSGLILDIFAKHARSRQAKIQVELAQLRYLLPRLTRQWQHLSRQVGGIGTRGPGETQLEVDRRRVRERISHLSRALDQISNAYQQQRKRRKGRFCVTLVGYTNAGKSTLFNALTGSTAVTEDRLFVTLDSMTRILDRTQQEPILLSDTVGFIKKLPPHLFASFLSSLEEVYTADLLVHVVDVSHPRFGEQMQTVAQVLETLGAGQKPTLLVFNKADRLTEQGRLARLTQDYPSSLIISALNQGQVERLKREIVQWMEQELQWLRLIVPVEASQALYDLYGQGKVISRHYEGNNWIVEVGMKPEMVGRFSKRWAAAVRNLR